MNIKNNDHLAEITTRLKTSSAIAPSLIFNAICIPAGSLGATVSEGFVQNCFIVLALLAPILTTIQIVYFSLKDPDRLQNEEHVERKLLISRMNPTLGDANSTVELDGDGLLIENPSIGGKA